MKPVLLVIARPNGSGKTTVTGPLPDWVADAVEAFQRHPDFVDLRVA